MPRTLLNLLIISILLFATGKIHAQEDQEIKTILNNADALIENGKMSEAAELLSPIVEQLRSEAMDSPSSLHYEIWQRWSRVTFDWYYYDFEQFRHEAAMSAPKELVQITRKLEPANSYRYTDAWLERLIKGIRASDSLLVGAKFIKLDSVAKAIERDPKLNEQERSFLQLKFAETKQIYYHINTDPTLSLQFGEEAIALLESLQREPTYDWVRVYQYQGYNYCSLNQFGDALGYFRRAIELSEPLYGKDYLGIGYIYDWITYCYSTFEDIDQIIENEKIAIAIYQKYYQPLDPQFELLYGTIANAYDQIRDYANSAYFYELFINLVVKNYGADSPKLLDIYDDLAEAQRLSGDYEKSIGSFKKAIAMSQQFDGMQSPKLASLYQRFGDSFAMMNRFKLATEYFEQEAAIYESYGDGFSYELAGAYHKIGASQTRRSEHEKAIIYLERAASTYLAEQKKRNWEYNTDLASTYKEMSQAYRLLQEYDSAMVYALGALPNIHKSDHKNRYYIYNELGLNYSSQGDYNSSLNYHFKAINSLKLASSSPNSFFASYRHIGDAYRRKGDYTQAISYLKKAQDLLDPDDQYSYSWLHIATSIGNTYNSMGELEKAIESFAKTYEKYASQIENYKKTDNRASDEFMHFLSDYASILFKKYHRDQDPNDLILAYQRSQQSVDIIQYVRQHLPKEQTRESWVHKHNHMFELNLSLAYEFYKQKGNDSDLNNALKLIETTKSFNLISALRTEQAGKFAGVPAALIEEEEKLKYEIQRLTNIQYQSDDEGNSIDSLIFEAQRLYEVFLKRLEDEYSTYFNLKYRSNTVRISNIQKDILKDGEAMILYALIDRPSSLVHLPDSIQSLLYTMAISPTEVSFKETYLSDNFNEDLQSYLDAISSYRPSDSLVKGLGINLYNWLLKEPLQAFSEQPKTLIIVPDRVLNYLPFEALPTPNSGNEISWLINDFTCSYVYSATLLQEQLRMKSKNPRHFFASFSAEYGLASEAEEMTEELASSKIVRSRLYPLPNAEKEAQSIAELMEGKSFLGKEATERSFKENAHEYQILHLALHTFFNDQDPLQSDLVFTPLPDSTEDGFLTTFEIYNLDLNAELAVLSACNTGKGKFQLGEGVKSLSRAISYVGVPSTIMSLWKVPDKSTSEIMLSFYTYLKAGLTKDEALRQAKLDYLKTAVEADQKSPLHWAGFVASGNMNPIDLPYKWTSIWISLLIGSLILILGFFLARNLTKSRNSSRDSGNKM